MESWTAWKAYWWDATTASFNWAVVIWPWQTVAFGVVIVAITTGVFWKLGRHDEVKNIAIGFLVSLGVSIVAFILIVLLIGPFLHWEGNKEKLSELETLRTEKGTFVKTIDELTAQRDDAIKQQKLFEEARDYQQQELDKVRRELASANKQLDDRKALIADKAARNSQREELAKFFDEGVAIKKKCFSRPSESPKKDFSEWINRVTAYIKSSMDSSHATLFVNTPPTDGTLQYMVGEKNVPLPRECNDTALTIDRKLDVLREFMSELK